MEALPMNTLLGILLFPFNVVIAIGSVIYWIVAALIKGGSDD